MDFFQAHGIWFLVGCLFLPRITMLFFVLTPFNWLAWLGWILTPSIVVAVLATSHYWHTNPVLCVFAWIVAVSKLGGSEETARRHRG